MLIHTNAGGFFYQRGRDPGVTVPGAGVCFLKLGGIASFVVEPCLSSCIFVAQRCYRSAREDYQRLAKALYFCSPAPAFDAVVARLARAAGARLQSPACQIAPRNRSCTRLGGLHETAAWTDIKRNERVNSNESNRVSAGALAQNRRATP